MVSKRFIVALFIGGLTIRRGCGISWWCDVRRAGDSNRCNWQQVERNRAVWKNSSGGRNSSFTTYPRPQRLKPGLPEWVNLRLTVIRKLWVASEMFAAGAGWALRSLVLYDPAPARDLTRRILSFTLRSMQEMPHAQTETFRDNLASLCAERGRIQEIADAAGLSRVFVSRIVHGHSIPTIDVAARIADAAGFQLSDLLKKSRKKLAVAG